MFLGKRIIFLSVAALLIAVNASAETYNPKQLVELAVKNSSLLKSQKYGLTSQIQAAEQASAWENPNFEISTERKVEAGGETNSVKYGLSQPIYLPGKYSLKQKISEADSEILKHEIAASEIKFKTYILNLIYSYKVKKEQQEHSQERLARLKTLESYLKSRVFASPQKKAESVIVSGKLLVIQKELMLRTGEKEILWAELNSYLKLGAEPEIASEWYVNAPKVELAALLENLETDNFEIQNQKMRLSQTQNQLELAKIESWPGVTVGASYSDGTGFSPERIYGLGISLPLPVFNSNSLARSSIKSKSQAETEKLNYVSEQTRREITEAYSKYQLAQKTVASLPIQKIAEFEKSIRAIDQDFKRGQVDLITYLEAENQHNESLSAIYEAQTDLVRSLTDLQVLTNKEQLF